jgi:hypothetical protein
VAGLYEASVRFEQIIETMEGLLDKKRMQRIKLGEKQYRKKAYVLARDAEEFRRFSLLELYSDPSSRLP